METQVEDTADDPTQPQSSEDSSSTQDTTNQVQVDIVSSNEANEAADDAPDRITGCRDGDTLHTDCMQEGSESEGESEEEEDDDDDDDGGGWITPSNIAAVKKQMGVTDMEEAQVEVGCLTLDFSMQVRC